MSFALAQPLGLLALLGIPAILAIHFLRRRSRTYTITTLFLLDTRNHEERSGPRFERFQRSIPLWLQLAAVLVLTWLLSGPRWVSETRVVENVVVVDESASMQAFRPETSEALRRVLTALENSGVRTEHTILGSRRGGRLYRGDSIAEAVASLDQWDPRAAAHSPEDALRLARSLSRSEGTVVFLTDQVAEGLPYAARLLAVGEPIGNVGFTGFRVVERADGPAWQATIRNYGKAATERTWHIALGESRGAERDLVLEPRELRTISGPFPEDIEKIELVLNPDRFPIDDRLPLLIPREKPITVSTGLPLELSPLAERLFVSIPELTRLAADGGTPDLRLVAYDPLDPSAIPPASIVFLHQESVPAGIRGGPVVSENHSLTEDLSWQGLITRISPSIPVRSSDQVLVWQGDHPLILLRPHDGRESLLFNFDVARSNAARLPALVILVHRFIETKRAAKVAPMTQHYEVGQLLDLAFADQAESPPLLLQRESGNTMVPLSTAPLMRAPPVPGFFRVTQGETELLEGAAWFADTREADFAGAASRDDSGGSASESTRFERHSDRGWQIFLLTLLLLLLLSWWFIHRESSPQSSPAGILQSGIGSRR